MLFRYGIPPVSYPLHFLAAHRDPLICGKTIESVMVKLKTFHQVVKALLLKRHMSSRHELMGVSHDSRRRSLPSVA